MSEKNHPIKQVYIPENNLRISEKLIRHSCSNFKTRQCFSNVLFCVVASCVVSSKREHSVLVNDRVKVTMVSLLTEFYWEKHENKTVNKTFWV